jgi:carboxypeptidase Q
MPEEQLNRTVFGPPEAAAILRQAVAPFASTGLLGATQDPIEYQTHSWHTNLDTYERIIEADAQASAMAIAAAVYHLAMRDEKLPRFAKEQMPALPTTTP